MEPGIVAGIIGLVIILVAGAVFFKVGRGLSSRRRDGQTGSDPGFPFFIHFGADGRGEPDGETGPDNSDGCGGDGGDGGSGD
ncbi:hypothetical protein [Dehalogenimonas sp. 4OHTPN]|uniref:Uncharacterized protein n=1 Tax=Dehalogenimonas sp. 4OHTPN TaxID=3166643 RepID=A0AAU8GAD6_9CHLR